MQNTPYDLSDVTPLDTLLLGRLQAAEMMLAGIISAIKVQLPSTKAVLDALVNQAGKGIENAEENAAAQWLYVTDHQGCDEDHSGSYEESLMLSLAAGLQITLALNKYLPPSGMTAPFGNIGHPVCIGLNRFLEPWGTPMDLPDRSKGFLSEVMSPSKGLTLYKSRALHPMGQEEPLFFVGAKGNHVLAIAPARMAWQVITIPDQSSPVFYHRQARVIDCKKAIKEIDEIFHSSRHSPKLRALLREKDDATTTIQVLLATIFAYDAFTMAEVNQVDLFHYRGLLRDHPKLGKVVLIHRVENQGLGLQLAFTQENLKHAFILVGESMVPMEMDTLQPQTKAIVMEVLKALVKKVKPSKKSATKAK